MAGVAAIIRRWLDLLEDIQPWGISKTSIFDQSKQTMMARVPDLENKLARFLAIKLPNPLSRDALFGKHDRPFTGPLVGYWHCHMAADAILIYRLRDRSIQLMLICQHGEIEGKRLKATARRLAA